MDGRLIGFAIIGSIFLFAAFVAYVITVVAAVACSIVIMALIQSKIPVIAKNDVFSTLVYSIVWGTLGAVIVFYTALLLIPAQWGLDAFGRLNTIVSDEGLFTSLFRTAVELTVVAFVTCYKVQNTGLLAKGARLTCSLAALGALQGYFAFEDGKFITVFFEHPSEVWSAVTQGLLGGFLVPYELYVILADVDGPFRSLIIEKYAIDAFNPYSYMNLIGAFVWAWAIFSIVFRIKPNVTDWAKEAGITEAEFWENIPGMLLLFGGCNFVVFYMIYLANYSKYNGFYAEVGAFEGLIGLVCLVLFIPAVVVMYGLLIFGPFFVLGASVETGVLERANEKKRDRRRTKSSTPPSTQEMQGTTREFSDHSQTANHQDDDVHDHPSTNLDFLKFQVMDIDPIDKNPKPGPGDNRSIEFKNTPRNAPCPCGSGKKFKHCHGKL